MFDPLVIVLAAQHIFKGSQPSGFREVAIWLGLEIIRSPGCRRITESI
jgi:hypothetical protein